MQSHSLKFFEIKSNFEAKSSLDRSSIENFFKESLDFIFPGMLRKRFFDISEMDSFLAKYLLELETILITVEVEKKKASEIVSEYSNQLINISMEIEKDARALLQGDPAAKNLVEVLLCYPGLIAIASHRIAHFFQKQKIAILPRLLSELAHEKTGIDIHPGAKIGESFFIDHGTGVVIGETAIIGNNVKMYQGVTLGALSVEKKLAEIKRHPTIKDNCVIYSHATILGGDTIIGEHSVIGGNVWITKSIPPYSMVYHKSEVKLASIDQEKNKNNKIHLQEELTYDI